MRLSTMGRHGAVVVGLLLVLRSLSACGGAPDATGDGTGSSAAPGSFENDTAALSCVQIESSSYDTSCETADECVAVTTGPVCANTCTAANDAINRRSASTYASDTAADSSPSCQVAPLGPVACIANRCQMVLPQTSAPSSGEGGAHGGAGGSGSGSGGVVVVPGVPVVCDPGAGDPTSGTDPGSDSGTDPSNGAGDDTGSSGDGCDDGSCNGGDDDAGSDDSSGDDSDDSSSEAKSPKGGHRHHVASR